MSGQKWLRNRSECLFLLHGFAFRPKPFKNRQLRNENEAALSVCFCCVASPSGQNHSRTGNYVTKTRNKFTFIFSEPVRLLGRLQARERSSRHNHRQTKGQWPKEKQSRGAQTSLHPDRKPMSFELLTTTALRTAEASVHLMHGFALV